MTRKLLRYALRSVWLLALLAVGALVMLSSYQAFASWRATSKWHPPGQLVDLGGGRRLHFQCDGEGDGLVVLVAGGGGFGWFWGNVRKEAARVVGTRVCSYDRPGAGWSDALTGSYSVATEAETLLSGLDALGAKQPVVLVGHSYGAFVAQAFTVQCRARVRALLLVEPNTVFFQDRNPHLAMADREFAQTLQFTGPLGVARWSFRRQLAPAFQKRFPNDAEMLLDMFSTTKSMRAQALQSLALQETFSSLRDWRPPDDLPVTVISRGKAARSPTEEGLWREGQQRLVRGHEPGRFIVATGSGHDVPRDAPDVVIEELERLGMPSH